MHTYVNVYLARLKKAYVDEENTIDQFVVGVAYNLSASTLYEFLMHFKCSLIKTSLTFSWYASLTLCAILCTSLELLTLSTPTLSIPFLSTSHFVNSHLVNIDQMRVDKVRS